MQRGIFQGEYSKENIPIWVISKDIGMEFGIDKCSIVCIKKGKIWVMEDIEMPNGQRMKNIKENGYKYLGIIQNILHKKWSFPFRISSVNVKETANLVTFTEEILNCKIHFLFSDNEINT